MLARLKRSQAFFDLFNEHAERVVEGSHELAAMIKTFQELDRHAQRIDELERAADNVTRRTIALAHQTYFTPFDHEQIHQLITAMDDILDLIQDAAESVVLYDVRQVTPEALQLAEICDMSCDRVKGTVRLLASLKQPDAILRSCEDIDRLEADADRVQRAALSKLFREEPDLKQVMKLRVVYELLEGVTDRCKDVAKLVEGIVLDNS